MILNEEYVVKIEKMINEGKALARINSLPVFIDNAQHQQRQNHADNIQLKGAQALAAYLRKQCRNRPRDGNDQ